jgi:hypothetical protein
MDRWRTPTRSVTVETNPLHPGRTDRPLC